MGGWQILWWLSCHAVKQNATFLSICYQNDFFSSSSVSLLSSSPSYSSPSSLSSSTSYILVIVTKMHFFFIFLQFPFLQCLSSLWPSSSSLSSSSSSPIFPLYKRHISCIHWRVSFSLSPFWVFVDPCSHPDGTAGPAFSVSTAKHRTWAPKMSLQMMRTAFLRTTWGGGALCFFPGVVIDAAAAWASAASCHISYFRPMGSSTALLTAMGLCPWWVGIHSHRHLWGSLCLKWW